jgi:hypothetical protein
MHPITSRQLIRSAALAFLGSTLLLVSFGQAADPPKDDKKDSPLREPVRKALDALKASEKNLVFQEDITMMQEAAWTKFKEGLEKVQKEKVADTFFDLTRAAEALEEHKDAREKEKDPYWTANYDYTLARIYVRKTQVLEYNAALGRVRRDDLPELDKMIHKGWHLVPQDKFTDREARELSDKVKELYKRLGDDHKDTPWEMIAQKEGKAPLAFTWVPAVK